MIFCTNCGTQANDDAKFCARCGAPIEKLADENQNSQQNYQQNAQENSQQYNQQNYQQNYQQNTQQNSQQYNQQNYQQNAQQNSQQYNQQSYNQNNYNAQGFQKTSDAGGGYTQQDIQQNKVMAVLSYIGIFVIIPICAAPNSKYARFHANQGLILLILEFIFGISHNIIRAVIYTISWRLGLVSEIYGLFGIAIAVLAIVGIVNAATGNAKELPLIGGYRILK